MLEPRITCDQCRTEITNYHRERLLARNKMAQLSFAAWDDNLAANESNILHMCSRHCAKQHLDRWLLDRSIEVLQKEAEPEPVPEPPATPATPIAEDMHF